jgi:hypothetical protein
VDLRQIKVLPPGQYINDFSLYLLAHARKPAVRPLPHPPLPGCLMSISANIPVAGSLMLANPASSPMFICIGPAIPQGNL